MRVVSRSVHDFGTCTENAATQCRLPTNFAAKHVFKSEVGTAQPHSLCKYQSRTDLDWTLLYIMILRTYHSISNSYRKMKC